MATEVRESEYGVNVGGRGGRETTDGKTTWFANFFASLFGRKVTSSNKKEAAA